MKNTKMAIKKNKSTPLKLERYVLNMFKYGTKKKGRERFNEEHFKDYFSTDEFTFEDFIERRKKYTRSYIEERLKKINIKLEELSSLAKIKTYQRFITPIRSAHKKHEHWGVLDIETCTNPEGIQEPYAWGFKIGDYESIHFVKENPYIELFETLKDNSQNNIIFYLHNLSNFDSYFIIKSLIVGDVLFDVIKTDRGFIKISVELNGVTINFHDSYNLLPSSLRDLAKTFNIDNTKYHIPYDFISINNLHYIGEKPNISFFPDITQAEYDLLPKVYTLKKEVDKYLIMDLRSLHDVLEKFMSRFLKLDGITITKFLTLPQIAFYIWRRDYLKGWTIPLLSKEVSGIIREAYYGGACEVYRPKAEKAWFYDVNSMYPWAMNKPMPVGHPKIFLYNDIDFSEISDNVFGFCRAEIETIKDDIYAPVLPKRHNHGIIFPTGKWKGWYFSEELKYAQTLGYYKIRVDRCYSFKQNDTIFKGYIEKYYEQKKNANDPVLRNICKMLLNTLYGRLGMRDINEETKIYKHGDEPKDYTSVKDVVDLGDFGSMFTMTREGGRTISNVAIAAAITSYARIEAFKIITENSKNIMYHDTDSFALTSPISSDRLGDALGQLKNVEIDKMYKEEDDESYYIKDVVFAAPKTYKYIKKDGEVVCKMKGVGLASRKPQKVDELYHEVSTVVKSSQFIRIKNAFSIVIRKGDKKLTMTDTKRNKIYRWRRWIDTSPLITGR